MGVNTHSFIRSLVGSGQNVNGLNETLSTTTANSVLNTTANSVQSNVTNTSQRLAELDIHRASFIWPEDPVDEMPVQFPRFYDHYANNRRLHMSALVPFGVMLVLSTIIFIMIIFRRWPGLVSGIVAGCLTFISIYLLLLTLKEEVLVYE